MKKKFTLLVSSLMLASALTACAVPSEKNAEKKGEGATASAKEKASPEITEVRLDAGIMTVYDYGSLKLHAYATGDALGDEAYILEGERELIGIELPCFTDNLETWKAYIAKLGKPMKNLFLDSHAAGADYAEGMHIYGTQGAKDAIAGGSTFATTQGLYEAFGEDFHGGPNLGQIDHVVSGDVTIGGIDFRIVEHGDSYDLEIPALNGIYTHMLGKTTHSIFTSIEQMDSMLTILRGYQEMGYDMILSSHSSPEGQDAVTEKIAYVEKAKELAAGSKTAEAFVAAMKEAFPDYSGENYLEMSAGFLYQ